MIGIEQAARSLGLSERQTYRRISAVRPLLSEHVGRGQNNSLQLDGSAIEILRVVEDGRKAGLTVSQSMERIRDSIGEKVEANEGKPEEDHPETEIPGPWLLVIAAKDETIRTLHEENARLRSEVDRLLPLALPSPSPRRRLFGFLVGRRSLPRSRQIGDGRT